MTCGNEPLGRSGLVAIVRCGHWWVYPSGRSVAELHALASFNLGVACSFCVGDFRAATTIVSRSTTGRVN